jgi:hypothetical protein
MVNTQMRKYTYKKITDTLDDYGQPTIEEIEGTIKIAINFTSEVVQDNSLYSDAQYVGLTLDKNINDTYIINYEGESLKVLYVNKTGKYKQVFMTRV